MNVMPKRMQVMKMQDELRREGMAPDTIDIDALTDASLSYPENARNVMKQFKNVSNASKKNKQNTFGIGNIDFSFASQSHAARPQQARQTDEATRAKRTYTERQVSRKPELLDQWFKHPGQIDIMGIDAFGSSKLRRTRKKRR